MPLGSVNPTSNFSGYNIKFQVKTSKSNTSLCPVFSKLSLHNPQKKTWFCLI